MSANPKTTTLAQKLVQITGEIAKSRSEKNGTNEYHRYKYLKASDVAAILAEKLTACQIASIVVPEILESKDVTNAKGGMEHLVTVKTDVLLVDAVSGETMTITGLGCGQDTGDKAVMKAQTAALKYAYMMSFNIATNDDPEADEGPDKRTASKQPEAEPKAKPTAKTTAAASKSNGKSNLACVECGCLISEKVYNYSKKKHGRALCYECQKEARQSA